MTAGLRILVVSDVSPVAIRGGGERVLWEGARHLAQGGHRIRILSRAPADGAPETVERLGIAIRHFPVDRRSLRRFLQSSIVQAGCAATRALEESDADVLHLHQPLSGYGALRAPAARRIPSLYTFLSPAPLEYRSRQGMTRHHRSGWAGSLGIALLWLIERACLTRATRVHVLSDFSGAQLRRLYRIPAGRIVKIPGGVDTERFQPAPDRAAVRKALGLPEGAPVLFTVRNLEARMGLDALIRAIALLRPRVPDVRLLIGGEGSRRGELEALIASLGLGGHVRLLGFVPERELPLYYQAADAFVLPTRELEGFGLVAVEALACGTPALGTPVGAIPEVLGGLGADLLFDGTGPEAIARGIAGHLERTWADAERAAALRRRCWTYAVTRFAWDPIVKQLEQELLRLAGRADGGASP